LFLSSSKTPHYGPPRYIFIIYYFVYLYIITSYSMTTLNIFNHLNYKEFIQIAASPEQGGRGTQSRLAKSMGCQASYLYQVLKGKADLTEDQAFRATIFFGFNEREREYFIALVRTVRASSGEYREFLNRQIQRLREEDLDLKNKADSKSAPADNEAWEYYFSGTLPSLIHVLTSSEVFQSSAAIAKRLRVPTKTVDTHLAKLAKFDFLKRSNEKWVHNSPSLHFAKDSKHNLILQLMRRAQASSSLVAANPESTHFSSLFTLDRESFEKLRKEIAEFVLRSQKLIHQGGTDNPYVLSLDLFDPTATNP
jgi:uncharacterized protein (TIGR02147 family)